MSKTLFTSMNQTNIFKSAKCLKRPKSSTHDGRI